MQQCLHGGREIWKRRRCGPDRRSRSLGKQRRKHVALPAPGVGARKSDGYTTNICGPSTSIMGGGSFIYAASNGNCIALDGARASEFEFAMAVRPGHSAEQPDEAGPNRQIRRAGERP